MGRLLALSAQIILAWKNLPGMKASFFVISDNEKKFFSIPKKFFVIENKLVFVPGNLSYYMGRLLALSAHIRLAWNSLRGTKASFFVISDNEKKFLTFQKNSFVIDTPLKIS